MGGEEESKVGGWAELEEGDKPVGSEQNQSTGNSNSFPETDDRTDRLVDLDLSQCIPQTKLDWSLLNELQMILPYVLPTFVYEPAGKLSDLAHSTNTIFKSGKARFIKR